MSRKNVEDIYPLSPLQQGILFHTLSAGTPGVYLVQRSWALEGALDAGAMARAFQAVVDRHPILRTAFVWDRHGRPMQVVREKASLPFDQLDLRGLPAPEQEARVRAFAEADRARAFELQRAPLMRVAVIRLGEAAHCLIWSTHHLLLDGWSTPIVTAEVLGIYDAIVAGHAPSSRAPRRPTATTSAGSRSRTGRRPRRTSGGSSPASARPPRSASIARDPRRPRWARSARS